MPWFNGTSQPHRTEQISGAVRLELGSYKPMAHRDIGESIIRQFDTVIFMTLSVKPPR